MFGLNRLVPILLVFSIIPRIGINAILTLIQVSYTIIINKTISKLKRISAKRKVNNALNT